jgi:alginate O-acetyltransferase complex protein AlgI
MIFNSIIYIIFLITTVIIYYLVPVRWRWPFLLGTSILYYLSFIPVFLGLIVVLILINFALAGPLAGMQGRNRKYLFFFIIISNVAILAFFKYFHIIFPGYHINLFQVDYFFRVNPANRLLIPLGLSYIIFTVLSYQIEIYRQSIKPEKHLGYFSLYLLFFPKIAQGPIERPQHLLPQLHQNRQFNLDYITEGFRLILLGYFKKLVIADRLSIYVNAVYDNSEFHNGTTLLLATVFFAFQIYADFSGYTDIALGSARLFGFNLTDNFRRPYFASSIQEFWCRWHITFSTWLRDYIFLPIAYFIAHKLNERRFLGISANSWSYTIAILATFIICGIWHGVGWNYLFWGLLFGIYLSFSNATKNIQKRIRTSLGISKTSAWYRTYSIGLTFCLVLFAWIFFRAATIPDALSIINKFFTQTGPIFYKPSELMFAVIAIGSLFAIDMKLEFFPGRISVLNNRKFGIQLAGVALVLVMILLLGVLDGGQFIYFQF